MLNHRPEREYCAEDLVGMERLTAGQAFAELSSQLS